MLRQPLSRQVAQLFAVTSAKLGCKDIRRLQRRLRIGHRRHWTPSPTCLTGGPKETGAPNLLSERFEACFGIRRKLMEVHKILARLVRANAAIVQPLSLTTLPDSARPTISDQFSSLRFASVAVDFLRLQIKPKLLGIQRGGFCSGNIIITLRCQEGGTMGTAKTTIGDHLRHERSLLSNPQTATAILFEPAYGQFLGRSFNLFAVFSVFPVVEK